MTVMSRPMFQGPPSGAAAETSPSPTSSGLESLIAGKLEGIEGSEDYISLMNAVRGDDMDINGRIAELAQIVGPEDASRTPISVLTAMQPAIAMMQKNGGGIESLVQGQEGQGAMPPVQGFADGGFANNDYMRSIKEVLGPERSVDDRIAERMKYLGSSDDSATQANLALMSYGAQVASTPGGLLQALARPMPDLASNLSKVSAKKAELERLIASGALDAQEKDHAQRQLQMLNGLEKSYSEANANSRSAASLAAAKEENQANRTFQHSEREDQQKFTLDRDAVQAHVQGVRDELNHKQTLEVQNLQQQFTAGQNTEGRNLQRELQDLQLKQQKEQGEANRQIQMDVLPSESFTTNGRDIITSVRGANGRRVDLGGKPLPENAVKVDDNTLTMMGFGKGTTAKDAVNIKYLDDGTMSSAVQEGKRFYETGSEKPITRGFTVLGKDAGTNELKNVTFTTKDDGQTVMGWADKQGNLYRKGSNNEQIPVDQTTIWPDSVKDNYTTRPTDRGTVLRTPNTGGPTEVLGGAPQGVPAPAPQDKPPTIGEINRNPGNPERHFVKEIPSPYTRAVPGTQGQVGLTPQEQTESRETIQEAERMVTAADELKKISGKGIGPKAKISAFLGDASSVIPNADSWVNLDTPDSRYIVESWAQKYKGAAALNKRFPVAEQAFLAKVAGNPDYFFKNPLVTVQRVQAIQREMRNIISSETARLEGKPTMLQLDRMPTGFNATDPYDLSQPNQKDYIMEKARLPNGQINPTVLEWWVRNDKTGRIQRLGDMEE